MRNRKQRKSRLSNLIILAALALSLPALTGLAGANRAALGVASERAAIFSAALNMPDGGLELLKNRFRSKLYTQAPEAPEKAKDNDSGAEHPFAIEHKPVPSRSEAEHIPEAEAGNSVKRPIIPSKYMGELVSENFAGREGTTSIRIPGGDGYIKNETKKSAEAVGEILAEDLKLDFADTDEPQVLLFHTHATESFERYDSAVYDTRNTWRSTDNNNNMVAVGSAMQQVLEENGIGVLHDTTQHDYPSYNGSYNRSAKTIKSYLEEYPSIKVVLDLHRDAMERENDVIVKPVALIDGKKAAQIMIIAGCDDGTMNMPNWPQNLRFAAQLQNAMEYEYPGLTRPVYFCYRKYNMDLSNGSLLLEFGSNANTLEEAVYSAQLAGQALAGLIKENMQK